MTNQEIINAFEASLVGKRKSEKTVGNYVRLVNSMVDIMKDKSIKDLTMSDLDLLRAKLNKKYDNEKTYNAYISALRPFITYIVVNDINVNIKLDKFLSDFVNIKIKNKFKSGQDIIPIEKYTELVKFLVNRKAKGYVSQRKKTVALVALTTGLRREEISDVKISEIDEKNGRMLVQDTKGDKPRIVTLPDYVVTEIHKLYDLYKENGIDTDKYLFMTKSNKKMHYTNVGRIVDGIMKEAVNHGIIESDEMVSPHGLRKSFFSWLILEKGLEAERAMELSGHSDINTLRRYVKVNTTKLTDDVNEMMKLD